MRHLIFRPETPKHVRGGHFVKVESDYSLVINVKASVENYAVVPTARRRRIIKIVTPLIKRSMEITSAWVG